MEQRSGKAWCMVAVSPPKKNTISVKHATHNRKLYEPAASKRIERIEMCFEPESLGQIGTRLQSELDKGSPDLPSVYCDCWTALSEAHQTRGREATLPSLTRHGLAEFPDCQGSPNNIPCGPL